MMSNVRIILKKSKYIFVFETMEKGIINITLLYIYKLYIMQEEKAS